MSGLSCHVLGKEEYEVRMYEKLIWISAFMIVGATNGGCTVGEVCDKHKTQLAEVIGELAGGEKTRRKEGGSEMGLFCRFLTFFLFWFCCV